MKMWKNYWTGGITGLRMDYGIAPKEIASVSHKMKVALNASTITKPFLERITCRTYKSRECRSVA